MPASISDFLSTFTTDLSRSNRFDVYITPPVTMFNVTNVSLQSLAYRCDVAQLPGRTIATLDRKTYGPIEKMPYITTYNDIDLTFYLDGDMQTKLYFDTWLDLVNPKSSNDFNYKSDYSTTIQINQYDLQNNLTYSVQLIEAWPININQLDLDWSSDGVHKLTVTFAYTYWMNNSATNILI